MDTNLLHIIVVSIFCLVLILFRCGYRLLRNCKIHTSCHRNWHQDDLYMAIAVIPLIGRAVSIGIYCILSGPNATPKQAVLAMKLLLPGRLCYALFQWCLKLCVASLYFRLTDRSTHMQRISRILWWFIVLTFVAVLLSTLLECRPLSRSWEYDPSHQISCQKGLSNLLTMAICNIVTDVALILLPIPVLWRMRLSTAKKIQLILVFGVGIFVIAVTTIRLPFIFDHSVDQRTRSMWASVEIVTACIVANVAFYYALLKDLRNGHSNSRASVSAGTARSSIGLRHIVVEPCSSKEIWRTDKMEVEYVESC